MECKILCTYVHFVDFCLIWCRFIENFTYSCHNSILQLVVHLYRIYVIHLFRLSPVVRYCCMVCIRSRYRLHLSSSSISRCNQFHITRSFVYTIHCMSCFILHTSNQRYFFRSATLWHPHSSMRPVNCID